MHIVVAHNALTAASGPDAQDVLVQLEAVSADLARMGHRVAALSCGLNLEQICQQLKVQAPDLVFNLVESLADTGRLIHVFPGLLDALGLSYTGASAEALFLTSNKLLAKQRLHSAGLPTPAWASLAGRGLQQSGGLPGNRSSVDTWIIKSVWEHASLGMDEGAVVPWRGAWEMAAALKIRAPALGGACFAEAFVEGREFNLSVLDGPGGPRVLPPAEIVFADYDADKPRIVDYRAKWDPDSFEYHHTPRRFGFADEDRPLVDQLTGLALACWQLFDLSGYARVDFRVDRSGRPWILEVNANPCLSPDAGFAAAIKQSGLTYKEALQDIIDAAKGIGSSKPGQEVHQGTRS